MFDWIDDVFSGITNTFGNLYNSVSSSFGNIFGTGTGSSVLGSLPDGVAPFEGAVWSGSNWVNPAYSSVINSGSGLLSGFNLSGDNLSNLIKAGMGIYGLATAGDAGGKSSSAAQKSADPYAPYRPQAAKELAALMMNPAIAYGQPGFQAKTTADAQALARLARAQGIAQSGNTANALQQQYINSAADWFNNYQNKLAVLAGATQSPATGEAASNLVTQQENKARTAALQTLMQSVGGLATGGFFG